MSSLASMPCCQVEKSKSLFDFCVSCHCFWGCAYLLEQANENVFFLLERQIDSFCSILPQNCKCARKQQNKQYVTICCLLRAFAANPRLFCRLNAAKFKFGHLQLLKPTIEKVDLTYLSENPADFFGSKVQFLRTLIGLFCQVSFSQGHQGQHVILIFLK